MEVIYILIPLSLVLVAVIVGFVVWAVRSGQFEDLDRPAHRILDDDDDIKPRRAPSGGEAGRDTETKETPGAR
ncbi:MAG TPA: cbb3-type cytochrome oxidase assembly protein CcoS [Arenicellales bacterium]|nr:cbb3-type cytochrome oxidase assembly protein CcoS [Arenicellales bacterium]